MTIEPTQLNSIEIAVLRNLIEAAKRAAQMGLMQSVPLIKMPLEAAIEAAGEVFAAVHMGLDEQMAVDFACAVCGDSVFNDMLPNKHDDTKSRSDGFIHKFKSKSQAS
tara:strand:+ start:304 stop:627 length:324 start_codon:yes stop_codon:yes gene_type:complete